MVSQSPVNPVVVDGFKQSPKNEKEPVFSLALVSDQGFRKCFGNQATIIVKNLSKHTFKDMNFQVEGTIDKKFETDKAFIMFLPPEDQRQEYININPLESGRWRIRLVVTYKDESGAEFKCAPTAWVNVYEKSDEVPQTVQNIINNNYRIGYIDGDIRTLQPIDQSKKVIKGTVVSPPVPGPAVRLQCRCRATLKQGATRCPVCGMQVLDKCPRCEARLWPDDFTCPECTMEIHRKVKLTIDSLESISGLRSRLTVQMQRCGETEWSAPVKNLLIRSSARFRLGRYYKTDDPKNVNDLVLVVHCLDEPKYDQWHRSNSKTAKLSKRLSRRQMDIVYHDGRFLVTWINSGKQVYLEKMGTADKVELDCSQEYKLQDGDILNIRGALRFRFKLLHTEVDGDIKTIGACLERQMYRNCSYNKAVVNEEGKTVKECTRKTEECLNHIGCCNGEDEYEHYFHNHYLFPEFLFIGGNDTDGLAIECPGLEKNRFKITAHQNRLQILDMHRKNPKPSKKIECF